MRGVSRVRSGAGRGVTAWRVRRRSWCDSLAGPPVQRSSRLVSQRFTHTRFVGRTVRLEVDLQRVRIALRVATPIPAHVRRHVPVARTAALKGPRAHAADRVKRRDAYAQVLTILGYRFSRPLRMDTHHCVASCSRAGERLIPATRSGPNGQISGTTNENEFVAWGSTRARRCECRDCTARTSTRSTSRAAPRPCGSDAPSTPTACLVCAVRATGHGSMQTTWTRDVF